MSLESFFVGISALSFTSLSHYTCLQCQIKAHYNLLQQNLQDNTLSLNLAAMSLSYASVTKNKYSGPKLMTKVMASEMSSQYVEVQTVKCSATDY